MNKSKKIKYITGLSVLGIISSAAPIIGTGFSNKKTNSSLKTSNADTNISTLNWFKRKQYSQSTSSGIQQCIKNDNLQLFNDYPALNSLTFTIDVTTTAGKANITLDASSGVSGFTGSINWIAKCAKPDPGPTPTPIETEVLYSELVALKNANQLTIGQKYRITDYNCALPTKSPTGATWDKAISGNHQFDIIVTATENNKLSEIATASKNKDDTTYFVNTNFKLWEIKYCIDNDTNRFDWAVSDTQEANTGKGVIYYMKDEFGNECPYDFKNIIFNNFSSYFYTFSTKEDTNVIDASIDNATNNIHNNIIREYYKNGKLMLNNIYFCGKNCFFNSFGINCHDNVFNSKTKSTLDDGSHYNNQFGNYCFNNTFYYGAIFNTFGNVFTENLINCYNFQDNTFYSNCSGNVFTSTDNTKSLYKNNTFDNGTSYIQVKQDAIFENNKVSSTYGTYGNPFKFDINVANSIVVNGKLVSSADFYDFDITWQGSATGFTKNTLRTSNDLVLKKNFTETIDTSGLTWSVSDATLINFNTQFYYATQSTSVTRRWLTLKPNIAGVHTFEVLVSRKEEVLCHKKFHFNVEGQSIIGDSTINMAKDETTKTVNYSVVGIDNPKWSVDGTLPTGIEFDTTKAQLTITAQSGWTSELNINIKASNQAGTVNEILPVKIVPTGLNSYSNDGTNIIQLADNIDPTVLVGAFGVSHLIQDYNGNYVEIKPDVLKKLTLKSVDQTKTIIGDNFLDSYTALTDLDLSGFTNVRKIKGAFLEWCDNLTNINLSGFTNVNEIGMNFMFGCTSVVNINISYMTNIVRVNGPFLSRCTGLESINVGSIQANVFRYLEWSFAWELMTKEAYNAKTAVTLVVNEDAKASWQTAITTTCPSFAPGATSIHGLCRKWATLTVQGE